MLPLILFIRKLKILETKKLCRSCFKARSTQFILNKYIYWINFSVLFQQKHLPGFRKTSCLQTVVVNTGRNISTIIICDVLEHIPDVGLVLDNIYKALETDGILYLIIPIYDSLSSRFHRLIHRKSKIDEAKKHDETHIHAFSKGDIIQLLSSHGFHVDRAIYTSNRLPFITGKVQRFTFGNRFGNWLSVIAKK